MRIAFYSDNFYPELTGISDSIITTGRELMRRGHEVLYVVPRYSEKNYRALRRYDAEGKLMHDTREDLLTLRVPSLPFFGSPTSQGRIAVPLRTTIPAVRRFRPDIIHTHTPFGVGKEALWTVRALGVPLVGTNHTPVETFMHYSPIRGKIITNFWLRHFASYYNRCRFVSAPYQGLIENMRHYGLRTPGSALPNPVLLDIFKPPTAAEKAAEKKKLGVQGPVLLYTGRLASEKNIDVIIKAVAELVDEFPSLILLMTGHGAAERGLRALAQKLGLRERVRFLGLLTIPELAEVYRAADIFVIMSTAETQSISLIQGYASGLPAITARAYGLPDYTPRECGFIVEPGDVGGLVVRLRQLLRDEPLQRRMGSAAAEYAKQFSPARIVGLWEEIYWDLLQNFSRTDLVKR